MHALARAILGSLALAVMVPATAQYSKVVDGLGINIGVVPVARLLQVDAHETSVHGETLRTASHHVVVGVVDARTGEPIDGARVTLEVEDPRGGLQSSALEAASARGYPDYSALVRFGWAGPYRLRVQVERAGAAPVSTTFSWMQEY